MMYLAENMARLLQCPGSAVLCEGIEPRISESAEQGAAAHWAAQELFDRREIDVGLVADNGVVLDAEMCDAATLFIESLPFGGVNGFRRRVSIPPIHPECYGYADYFSYGDGVLHVAGFHYGHGFVDEYNNPELLALAIGLRAELSLPADTRYVITVVQPRYYGAPPVRSHNVSDGALDTWTVAMKTVCDSPMETVRTGSACLHCPARATCATLKRASSFVADIAGVTAEMSMPLNDAERELAMLEGAQTLVKARISGLEAQIAESLKPGETGAIYSLRASAGRLDWSAPPAEVIDLLGDEVAKRAVITPTQALKAGVDKDLVGMLSARKAGEPKLTKIDTKRVFNKGE